MKLPIALALTAVVCGVLFALSTRLSRPDAQRQHVAIATPSPMSAWHPTLDEYPPPCRVRPAVYGNTLLWLCDDGKAFQARIYR